MNLVLIGYRGTGKTTVARHLAHTLGWDWVDADVEVELRAGKSIQAIFAAEGEPAFRDLESAVLADMVNRDRTVIAAGGGIVLRPANRVLLRKLGQIVWLTASVDTIVDRLQSDPLTTARRPDLTRAGGRTEIEQLLSVREPLYTACADLSISTDSLTPEQIAAEINARLDLSAQLRERS